MNMEKYRIIMNKNNISLEQLNKIWTIEKKMKIFKKKNILLITKIIGDDYEYLGEFKHVNRQNIPHGFGISIFFKLPHVRVGLCMYGVDNGWGTFYHYHQNGTIKQKIGCDSINGVSKLYIGANDKTYKNPLIDADDKNFVEQIIITEDKKIEEHLNLTENEKINELLIININEKLSSKQEYCYTEFDEMMKKWSLQTRIDFLEQAGICHVRHISIPDILKYVGECIEINDIQTGHGFGIYISVRSRYVYIGQFNDGEFDGEGEIHFYDRTMKFQMVDGNWKKGNIIEILQSKLRAK